ncbi:hypothetical protein CDV31_013220 [Fusarium ambrosium]|uniref:Uncharacterized protein n=1 Tax=Fusarium ambrosium TaxID=131363 RepID=A0A428T4V8_9HYPO|nr:hypothetical protein CDV31_013220 [Fusarium ambrosium]
MAPDPAPPLPLAANRAALSNRISLLLASQSSVLKTMNLGKPPPPPTTKHRRLAVPENDDDLVGGSRPNEGVGYVPDKKDAQKIGNAKEERMLRGRLLGKDGKSFKKRVEESESEDDVGRSALGKRKRPRKEVEPEQEAEPEKEDESTEKVEEKTAEVDGDINMKDGNVKVEGEAQQVTPSDESANKKRKKKNKKKKQKAKNAEEK